MTSTVPGSALARVQVPPYDVLGYLLPGAAFYFIAVSFEFWAAKVAVLTYFIQTPFLEVARQALSSLEGKDWAASLLVIVVVLTIWYVSGHAVASFSAFFLDRVYLARAHGYPFRQLLRLGSANDVAPATRAFYRAAFFWFNLFVVSGYARHVTDSLGGPTSVCLGLLSWVALLLFVAAFIGKLLRNALTRSFAGPLARRLTSAKRARYLLWVERSLTILAAPYDWGLTRIAGYLHTRRPFEKSFCRAYKEDFQETFGIDPRSLDTNNYWLAYLHVAAASPPLAALAANWHRLYSFARNLATTFYLGFLYCFLWLLFHSDFLKPWPAINGMTVVVGPAVLLALAYLMLLRYYYLYANYFTKFVFRAFLYLKRVAPDCSAP